MNPRAPLLLSRLCFFVLLVVISWLAFTPHPPRQADLGWDKLNHFSAFATLMVFAAWSWPRHWPLTVAGAALFALVGLLVGTRGVWMGIPRVDLYHLGLAAAVLLWLRAGVATKR